MPTKMKPDPEQGEALYEVNCWQCHGRRALGNGPLADALPSPTPALAGRIQEEGYPAAVDIILEGRGDMPSFADVMDRYDSRRILRWLVLLDPETGADPTDEPKKPEPPSPETPGSQAASPEKPSTTDELLAEPASKSPTAPSALPTDPP